MPKRKVDPKRFCRFCGARLHRKFYGATLEDLGRFKLRKFCDLSCSSRAQHHGKTVSRSALLWRARRYRKPSCEDCGTTSRLHVHHDDRNVSNNEPANLVTLCASCHIKRHWREDGRRKSARSRRTVSISALESLYRLAREIAPSLPTETRRRLESIVLSLRGASAAATGSTDCASWETESSRSRPPSPSENSTAA